MMRIFPESQGNILGILLSQKITKKDYRDVLGPAFDRVISEHGKVRVLFDFADDFAGFEIGIFLEDARIVVGHLKQIDRVALINCPTWLRPFFMLVELTTKRRSQFFKREQHAEAWDFIEGNI